MAVVASLRKNWHSTAVVANTCQIDWSRVVGSLHGGPSCGLQAGYTKQVALHSTQADQHPAGDRADAPKMLGHLGQR